MTRKASVIDARDAGEGKATVEIEETTTVFSGPDEETVDKWVKAMKPVAVTQASNNIFQGQMNAARAVVSGNRKRYQVRQPYEAAGCRPQAWLACVAAKGLVCALAALCSIILALALPAMYCVRPPRQARWCSARGVTVEGNWWRCDWAGGRLRSRPHVYHQVPLW